MDSMTVFFILIACGNSGNCFGQSGKLVSDMQHYICTIPFRPCTA